MFVISRVCNILSESNLSMRKTSSGFACCKINWSQISLFQKASIGFGMVAFITSQRPVFSFQSGHNRCNLTTIKINPSFSQSTWFSALIQYKAHCPLFSPSRHIFDIMRAKLINTFYSRRWESFCFAIGTSSKNWLAVLFLVLMKFIYEQTAWCHQFCFTCYYFRQTGKNEN